MAGLCNTSDFPRIFQHHEFESGSQDLSDFFVHMSYLLFVASKIAQSVQEGLTCLQACTRACPKDIEIPEYLKAGARVLSTECIICQTCITVCPEKNLTMTFKLDVGGKEELRRRKL